MNSINTARSVMARDPDAAAALLKLVQENVIKAPELDPGLREQLRLRIETALQAVAAHRVVRDQQVVTREEQAAIQEDIARVRKALHNRELKTEQLMARFNSLMSEKRFHEAENIADLASELSPYDPALTAADITATMSGAVSDAMAIRSARVRGVLATLGTVEYAHIPTPDEPPIVYPDAQWWRDMTARRKKYASVDLANTSPTELKIRGELDKPTQMEFIETPLQDVVDFLKDYHHIEIQLDRKALDDAAIGSDTPVTRNIHGVSLKSALRLMLGEMGLTYVIDNEVLLITTREVADQKLATKVYPVADLVLPIPNPIMFSMMGMMANMMGGMGGAMMGGGMGGGMGGMGGGMGGMGGGMGGMGGGMGGMGMGGFSVPAKSFVAFAVKDGPIKLGPKQDAQAAPAKQADEVKAGQAAKAGTTAKAGPGPHAPSHRRAAGRGTRRRPSLGRLFG